MKIKNHLFSIILLTLLALSACGPSPAPAQPVTIANTEIPATVPAAATETATVFVPPPSPTPEATLTFTPLPPTETLTPTSIPSVESLQAKVTALLSCRYGPGSEYLYLYGLNKGANINLIGRTDANNWVMVDGRSRCWVNAKFLEIAGDQKSLPVLYPDKYKLPVSPYYSPTTGVIATRDKNDRNKVEVSWNDVPLRAGDEEDADMNHYIIEVWRCESGQIIFDPLATNELAVTFMDEAGCGQPSHGRVFVQDKHGFAGPSEIPWPAR
ncbi:MAG: hypothetical protein MUO77_05840 [Anaerolineales bacterium]|nr:hypothetical protein [Anaerolineales bacterium]